ncbi:MAG: cytochrome c3 family protein [Desulfobulbaceae bacterium]|nr:cytochrome c3 family protein [Desulfobulbaceae bacterium]
MLKKLIACSVVTLFLVTGTAILSVASDAGPEEITMVGAKSKKPKPSIFPHKKHQDSFKCAECHHGMADGKQVPYAEGQDVAKCESCHNKDVLAGKKSGKLKLDTIKGAGHGNCLACHKKMAKENAELKAKKIAKCAACHPKKKK